MALHVSLLSHHTSSLTRDLLPFSGNSAILSPAVEANRTSELVNIAESIHQAHQMLVAGPGTTRMNVDLGVVPTLHVAAKLCRNEAIRDRLRCLIQAWPKKESVWDAPALRNLHVY